MASEIIDRCANAILVELDGLGQYLPISIRRKMAVAVLREVAEAVERGGVDAISDGFIRNE